MLEQKQAARVPDRGSTEDLAKVKVPAPTWMVAAGADALLAFPAGILAGVLVAIGLGAATPAIAAAIVAAGAWLAFGLERGLGDARGRSGGRWLGGLRVLSTEGGAPSRVRTLLRALAGPLALIGRGRWTGAALGPGERLGAGERLGGAASAARLWLPASGLSAAVLAIFGSVLMARLHAGYDAATWKAFAVANANYGCCSVRHEVPLHWDACSVAIDDVLKIRAHGHVPPEPASLTSTLGDCPAADLVSVIGAGVAMPAIPQKLALRIDDPATHSAAARFATGDFRADLAAAEWRPVLSRLVSDSDPAVVSTSVNALRLASGMSEADRRAMVVASLVPIRAALSAPGSFDREPLLWALGESGDAKVAPVLHASIEAESGSRRAAAIEAMLRIDSADPAACSAFAADLLSVDTLPPWAEAFALLQRMGTAPAPVRVAVGAAANSDDPGLRARAANLLARPEFQAK